MSNTANAAEESKATPNNPEPRKSKFMSGLGKIGSGIGKGVGGVVKGVKQTGEFMGDGLKTGFDHTVGAGLETVGLKKKKVDAMITLKKHFGALTNGSMIIALDNSEESHPID